MTFLPRVVDGKIKIDEEACECATEAAKKQDPKCRILVLQSIKGSIHARRISEETVANRRNMASAGRHQTGEGMETVERLRQLRVEFSSAQGKHRRLPVFSYAANSLAVRSVFATAFKELQRLYIQRTRGFQYLGDRNRI